MNSVLGQIQVDATNLSLLGNAEPKLPISRAEVVFVVRSDLIDKTFSEDCCRSNDLVLINQIKQDITRFESWE